MVEHVLNNINEFIEDMKSKILKVQDNIKKVNILTKDDLKDEIAIGHKENIFSEIEDEMLFNDDFDIDDIVVFQNDYNYDLNDDIIFENIIKKKLDHFNGEMQSISELCKHYTDNLEAHFGFPNNSLQLNFIVVGENSVKHHFDFNPRQNDRGGFKTQSFEDVNKKYLKFANRLKPKYFYDDVSNSNRKNEIISKYVSNIDSVKSIKPEAIDLLYSMRDSLPWESKNIIQELSSFQTQYEKGWGTPEMFEDIQKKATLLYEKTKEILDTGVRSSGGDLVGDYIKDKDVGSDVEIETRI